MTSIPASVQSATVPAALKSTSSGWAAITRIRWISESSSMAQSYGRRHVTDFGHRNRDETDVIMTRIREKSKRSCVARCLPVAGAPGDAEGAAPAGAAPRECPRSVERGHDVLDAGVVLEPVHGQVLAVAGVLEAAVRHLGH